jgi:uncharacterized membrane protein YbjE (DUF340 family)
MATARLHARRNDFGKHYQSVFSAEFLAFLRALITKFKVGSDFAVAVGGEWYPYSGMELIMNFPVALAAMLIGYIYLCRATANCRKKRRFF